MSNADDQIAELKRELDRLKPTTIDHDAARAHRNAIHQASEARMSRASAFSRDQLAEMAAACPDDAVKDIVRHGRIPGPSGAGASGQVAKVSSNAGLLGSNTTGWRESTPIGPPPGIAHVDRLIDAQDQRDYAERVQEAKAMQKALKR